VGRLNGHTVAGGCIVALACDRRVMLAPEGKAAPKMGLNEAALGMTLPW
jgi:enoyl-CoA hydratase/carnithine racemase